MDWVQQMPQSPLRQQLLGALAVTASSQDPAAAASVTAMMDAGPNQNRTAIAVLKRWVLQDRDAATSWAEQFPKSDVKSAADAALVAPTLQ